MTVNIPDFVNRETVTRMSDFFDACCERRRTAFKNRSILWDIELGEAL